MSDRRIGTVVKVPSIRLRELVERATGVEPATSSLGSWHSTTELHPPTRKSRCADDDCQIGLRRLTNETKKRSGRHRMAMCAGIG
jgi:hypothetical protein